MAHLRKINYCIININKVLLGIVVSLALSGCVSTSVIPTSTTQHQPLAATQDVSVYMSDRDVKVPFTVVGAIHHYDIGKYQRLDLNDVLPILKDKARSLGANGVIIDKQEAVVSGIFSRGIDVSARAIKF